MAEAAGDGFVHHIADENLTADLLAEMGWRQGYLQGRDYNEVYRGWHDPGGSWHQYLPQPLLDISADFMVLEWVRDTWDRNGAMWCDVWFELGHSASYEVGDWARATYKAIENERLRKEKRSELRKD